MAKNENKSIERTYTIPLRREWIKTVKYKRSKKAIRAIKEFLRKHMKSDEVRVGNHLNEHVWKHGIKNPPSRVKINTKKYEDGLVVAELHGKPLPERMEDKAEKKGMLDRMKEKAGIKDDVKKPKKEDKKTPVAKEEVKKEETPAVKEKPKEEAKPAVEAPKKEEKEEAAVKEEKAVVKEEPKEVKTEAPDKD